MLLVKYKIGKDHKSPPPELEIRFESDKTRRLPALRAKPDSIPEALALLGTSSLTG